MRSAADTGLFIWHEWQLQKDDLGWHKSSSYYRVQELAGFAPIQGGRRHSDPVPWHVIRSELALTVDGFLKQLPESDAKLLVLRVIGGYSFAKIGDRLHLSKHAARRRFISAHAKLEALIAAPLSKIRRHSDWDPTAI